MGDEYDRMALVDDIREHKSIYNSCRKIEFHLLKSSMTADSPIGLVLSGG